MRPIIHHTTCSSRRSGATQGQLRQQMVRLRGDIDRYEQTFSTWTRSRPLRESQADVRFHVIEAQLARLTGSDTIGASPACPVALPVSPQPVLYPIASYRL